MMCTLVSRLNQGRENFFTTAKGGRQQGLGVAAKHQEFNPFFLEHDMTPLAPEEIPKHDQQKMDQGVVYYHNPIEPALDSLDLWNAHWSSKVVSRPNMLNSGSKKGAGEFREKMMGGNDMTGLLSHSAIYGDPSTAGNLTARSGVVVEFPWTPVSPYVPVDAKALIPEVSLAPPPAS